MIRKPAPDPVMEAGSFYEKLCEVTQWLADHGVEASLTIAVKPGVRAWSLYENMFVSRIGVNKKGLGTWFRTPNGRVHIRDWKPKKQP